MADVFLSYKREDAAKARKLVAALRAAGLAVWWDEDIPASAPWETTIEKALKAAKSMVVCWSPDSVDSENVRSEARVAREDGRLVQVFLKSCTPPLFFGERQGVDLTSWRGNPTDRRIKEIIASVRRVAGIEEPIAAEATEKAATAGTRLFAVAAAILLFVGAGIGWWFLSPAKAEGPTTLAVLPFRALNPADANLVDAIWDDTRGAIGRNPNLRVIGRQAVEALAKDDLQPAEYRKKVGADYLLDGSVQHVGDQVRMKLSLTRTTDGAEVWSDEVGGKLDDVFKFQERVASEVEGLIRGRVAPGGGKKTENIATTGDVYALYAEARAKDRLRDPANARQAKALLKKALAIDPNYAPAWAELGIATNFTREGDMSADAIQAEAIGDFRRALTLAPNLAYAHAGLAMVQGFPPQSEAGLRRAIALDPGNAEAWMWLGNLLSGQYRTAESLDAYTRAAAIEPLWFQSVGNKISGMYEVGDKAGVERELERIKEANDPALFEKLQWRLAQIDGRPGDAIRIMLHVRATYPQESGAVDQRIGPMLIQVGLVDQALVAQKLPPELASDYYGKGAAPSVLDQFPRPLGLFQDSRASVLYARLLPNNGRLDEFVGRYRAAFASPDDFLATFADRPDVLATLGPNVVTNLRAAGMDSDANAILAAVEAVALRYLKNAPDAPDLQGMLAYIRAAEGRDDEVVALLRRGIAGRWLPDGIGNATDIAQEPCFARFLARPDFQAVRRQILGRIAEERRKVPLSLLAQAYPAQRRAAA